MPDETRAHLRSCSHSNKFVGMSVEQEHLPVVSVAAVLGLYVNMGGAMVTSPTAFVERPIMTFISGGQLYFLPWICVHNTCLPTYRLQTVLL